MIENKMLKERFQRQQINSPKTVKKVLENMQNNQDKDTHNKPRFKPKKQFTRNHPLDYRYISFLDQQKNQSLNQSLYSQAQNQQKIIKCLKQDIRISRIRSLSLQHSQEKQSIKNAHLREMKSFRKAWRQIFQRNRLFQVRKVAEFQRQKQKDIQYARQEVLRRCKSARPSVRLMEIRDLQRNQRNLRKQGRYKQLKKIRSQKKQKKKEYQRQSQKIYKKIVEQQEKKLSSKQTKRYNSFISRMQSSKKDCNLQYKRQQLRLKRKYNNIIKNLQHQQKVQLNKLLATLPI